MYAMLEPFTELRADYRSASIASVIANVNRAQGQRAYTVQEFLLKFEEAAAEEKVVHQTPEQQEAMMRIIMGIPLEAN